MSAQEGTAEVAFLRGMEREPPKESHDENWMLRYVREQISDIRKTMLSERGPSDVPYAELQARVNEMERTLDRIGNGGGYHEAPKPNGASKSVIVGCTIALISAGFVAAWGVGNRVTALETTVNQNSADMRDWKASVDHRIEKLEDRVRP